MELLRENKAQVMHKVDSGTVFAATLPCDACVWATGTTLHAVLTNSIKKCGLVTDYFGYIRLDQCCAASRIPAFFFAGK